MKLFVFIAIELLLSYFAAAKFCGELEVASASRATREDGTRGRSLELGYKGRAIVTVALLVGLLFIALLSKWLVVSTILAMIVSVGLVWANVYLRGININSLTSFFCLWIGTVIAGLYQQSKVGAENGWATFYIIFEVVMLALLVLGTVIVKFNRYRMEMREEDEEAEEIEEDVDHVITEPDDEESEGEASDEDDDEDDDDYWERDARKEEIIGFILHGVIVVLIIGVMVALGFWLEAKFDFFPPYKL